MSRSKRPGSDKSKSKGSDSCLYQDSDSRNIWEDDIERELNAILEKAKRADPEEYSAQFEGVSSDCVPWDKSLHLQTEDLSIIDYLWQLSLEGSYSERTLKLLRSYMKSTWEVEAASCSLLTWLSENASK